MQRSGPGEDDRFAAPNFAAAVDDAHVTDVEPLRGLDRNIFQRLPRERRMMLKHQSLDDQAILRSRPRNSGEADNCTVADRLLEQSRELLLWPQRMFLEARNDAHPPDTGGRNSTLSVAVRT